MRGNGATGELLHPDDVCSRGLNQRASLGFCSDSGNPPRAGGIRHATCTVQIQQCASRVPARASGWLVRERQSTIRGPTTAEDRGYTAG
jgi:hypothetical protein